MPLLRKVWKEPAQELANDSSVHGLDALIELVSARDYRDEAPETEFSRGFGLLGSSVHAYVIATSIRGELGENGVDAAVMCRLVSRRWR